jgi:hypothetical protein
MAALSQLSFGAPLVLAALVVLPVLYWLLRVTPPLPKRIPFPPLRLLKQLPDEEQTPAKTPWWLLLLRLIAAALLIFALADPLLGQSPKLPGTGPLVLMIDNGWSAAKNWDQRQDAIADLLRAAGERPVMLLPTASPAPGGLLNAGEAARLARELKPMPWPGDRDSAAAALAKMSLAAPAITWLSDGLEDGSSRATATALKRKGPLTVYAPRRLAYGLLPVVRDGNGFGLTAIRPIGGTAEDVEAAAIGARGETLAVTKLHFPANSNRAKGHIALPLDVRNETARLEILGEDSAGAVQLLDSGALQRRVGVVAAAEGEAQPLLSDVYYIERALQPFAEVDKGTITALLARHVTVLMLADVGRIPGADMEKVSRFVSEGGVLIRFAGDRMTVGADTLVPVPLRVGGRYLGSAMSWAAPQHPAPFAEASPFNGLSIPNEVTVSRQILAEPSSELSDRAWARLADGTPLITARQMGQGWIVLFHITANPAWSTLPLSGLYVDMLKRLLALAAGTPASDLAGLTSLPPVSLLDGAGRTVPPSAEAQPIAAKDFSKTEVSPSHPPGLYGAHGVENALNELKANDTLMPMQEIGQALQSYGELRTKALQPWLLATGAALLLLDALLALLLRGFIPKGWLGGRKLAGGAAVMLLALTMMPHPARADDTMAMKAALATRLAYVKTGLADVDETSERGLTGLGYALRSRTSYEPLEPIGVDLARDDLSFFPLLYWPMDPRAKNLSPATLAKLSDYMRQGGTILFDTRDLTLGAVRGAGSPGEQTLRRLTQGLDMPKLEPVPGDHVLTKAFYILHDFPGRWQGGQVWVEALPPSKPGDAPARGGDGVSPVIIGGNDWAAAWAVDRTGRFVSEVVPGGEMQREMAFRFGINLVMYALTGNYKTDQVHAPALLERMGR